MFVKKVKKPNGSTAIQIAENTRKGDKVCQKILRHMGTYVSEVEIEKVVSLAESLIIEMKNNERPALPGFEMDVHTPKTKPINNDEMVSISSLKEEKRIHQGIDDVFGHTFEELGLKSLFTSGYKKEQTYRFVKEIVLARLSQPLSKRKTAKVLDIDKAVQIPLEKIYRTMDKVSHNEKAIKDAIAKTTLNLFNHKIEVAFFDVTTLYFESFDPDDLRKFGFSKDCKFKETQVMLALITTTDGHPLGYELFPGNTYEGHTLIKVIDALKESYDIANTFIVADRAMFTEANLAALDERKVKFIIAAKLKALPQKNRSEILSAVKDVLSKEPTADTWTSNFKYGERRLVVSYSKARAEKDKKDRERLVERIKKKMKDGKVRVEDLIGNSGTKKYLKFEKKNEKVATLNEEKIKADAEWDGIHGAITNHEEKDVSAEEILIRYKGLWQIEAAFRVNKHDLKMRPIYHWKTSRIKAHILLCFVAYSVACYTKDKLKKAHINLSLEEIRDELNRLQVSIVKDIKTKKCFSLPSKMTENQKKIYKALGLDRNEKTEIL